MKAFCLYLLKTEQERHKELIGVVLAESRSKALKKVATKFHGDYKPGGDIVRGRLLGVPSVFLVDEELTYLIQ
ncbi:hypothetical protein KJA15_01475 [Patescibacteria group bacterium]|nr:hypothetical protein [Patescibacteria group bacterium]